MIAREVAVAQLEPGDWITRIGSHHFVPARQVDQVTPGSLPGVEPGLWGVSFEDGTAMWVAGEANMTATLGFPELRFTPGMTLRLPGEP